MTRRVRHTILVFGILLTTLIPAAVARSNPAEVPAVPALQRVAMDAAGRAWVTVRVGYKATGYVRYFAGIRWHRLPSPPVRNLGPILPFGKNDVWVVGGAQKLAHWDGTRWTVTPHPTAPGLSFVDIAGSAPDDVWVVGRQNGVLMQLPGDGPGEQSQLSKPAAMHWDGQAWALVPLPELPGVDQSIEAVAAGGGRVWAVGRIEHLLNGDEIGSASAGPLFRYEPLALRWTGEEWRVVAHDDPGDGGTYLVDVAVLPSGTPWIVGIVRLTGPDVIDAREHWQTLVERRGGSGWLAVQQADVAPRWQPWSIATLSGHKVWVAGIDRRGEPSVERWNGTSWGLRTSEDLGWRRSLGVLGVEPDLAAGSDQVWMIGWTFIDDPSDTTGEPMAWRHTPSGWAKVPFAL